MSGDLLSRVCGEIDARMRELRPAVSEYERLLDAAGSSGPDRAAAKSSSRSPRGDEGALGARRPTPRAAPAKRAGTAAKGAGGPRDAVGVAIVAALEHGSHTVSELVVVTAMSAARVREGLRRLTRAGTVTRAQRDGKAAYALSSSPT
jgi:DNA-binding transcriptional ArsR family regulator